ncbi:dihydrodipicolinate synthase family protein [Brachybacterium rhamnosum]|uniref:Dihydrodipicolinate synthase family protein n=1 Tax=Brachybacterium rhamnosum TaxID=173361 RepID=A0ABW4Q0T1_9MICO
MSAEATWLRGLSAFPLTPLRDGALDEHALTALVRSIVEAGPASIGVLGSTGVYPYLPRDVRRRAIEVAVAASEGVPVLAGIGALATADVLALAEDAQTAGAGGVLLAPVSYHPLADPEVVGLFSDVAAELSVPLVVYDNPGTTHVTFTPELHAEVAALPAVAGIKIPPVPAALPAARERVAQVRSAVPEHVRVGVSGDAVGAVGLEAGCDLWFSALGGVLPEQTMAIVRAHEAGRDEEARALAAHLDGFFSLFAEHGGSVRVIAEIAVQRGLVGEDPLPRPLRGLDAAGRARVADELAALAASGDERADGLDIAHG